MLRWCKRGFRPLSPVGVPLNLWRVTTETPYPQSLAALTTNGRRGSADGKITVVFYTVKNVGKQWAALPERTSRRVAARLKCVHRAQSASISLTHIATTANSVPMARRLLEKEPHRRISASLTTSRWSNLVRTNQFNLYEWMNEWCFY